MAHRIGAMFSSSLLLFYPFGTSFVPFFLSLGQGDGGWMGFQALFVLEGYEEEMMAHLWCGFMIKGRKESLRLLCSLNVFYQSEKQISTQSKERLPERLSGIWAWQLAGKQGLGCKPYVLRDALKTHCTSRTLSHGWFACYKRLILSYNFILSILNF